jgi:hypothetical protein
LNEAPAGALKTLNLQELAAGMPGLTPAGGRLLLEAAMVCLESCGHSSGVTLVAAPKNLSLEWAPIDDRIRRAYADMQESVEWGACGAAILVLREATSFVVVERAVKGLGVDYWIGLANDDMLFQRKARLEVSGILRGTEQQIAARMRAKTEQTRRSDALGPAFVAVIEFGRPLAWLDRR